MICRNLPCSEMNFSACPALICSIFDPKCGNNVEHDPFHRPMIRYRHEGECMSTVLKFLMGKETRWGFCKEVYMAIYGSVTYLSMKQIFGNISLFVEYLAMDDQEMKKYQKLLQVSSTRDKFWALDSKCFVNYKPEERGVFYDCTLQKPGATAISQCQVAL